MDEQRREEIEDRLVTYRSQKPVTGSVADWYIRDVAWLLTELHLIRQDSGHTEPPLKPLERYPEF